MVSSSTRRFALLAGSLLALATLAACDGQSAVGAPEASGVVAGSSTVVPLPGSVVPSRREMGQVEPIAAAIASDGPIVLNDAVVGDSHVVLDHVGVDFDRGWVIYLAHPADRTSECAVSVVVGTRDFTDCEGRTLSVGELALPPAGVSPIVNIDGTLSLDLEFE